MGKQVKVNIDGVDMVVDSDNPIFKKIRKLVDEQSEKETAERAAKVTLQLRKVVQEELKRLSEAQTDDVLATANRTLVVRLDGRGANLVEMYPSNRVKVLERIRKTNDEKAAEQNNEQSDEQESKQSDEQSDKQTHKGKDKQS